MEEKFVDVLEKGEQVIKVYTPNKCKFWTVTVLWSLFSWIWVFTALLGAIPQEGAAFDACLFWLLFGISAGVFVVGMAVTFLFCAIYLKNRFYAYTGKRIIIRGGIIGIDYKSLEFKHLTATIVNVSVIDKIVRKNTGSIQFGSPSAPVGGASYYGMGNPYAFRHILKPYDTLREIKEIIDTKS